MRLLKSIVYGFWSLFILLGVVAAVWTVIPDSSQRANFMGTFTHCPWVPTSTYLAIGVAVIGVVAVVITWRFWR